MSNGLLSRFCQPHPVLITWLVAGLAAGLSACSSTHNDAPGPAELAGGGGQPGSGGSSERDVSTGKGGGSAPSGGGGQGSSPVGGANDETAGSHDNASGGPLNTADSGDAASGGANRGGGGVMAAGGTNSGGAPAADGAAGKLDAEPSGGSTGSGGMAGTPGTTAGVGPTETKPTGYGQATTGGGSAATVEVSTLSACQDAIDAYSGSGGLVLKYTGKFDYFTIPDPCTQHEKPDQTLEIKRKSNVTILGEDGSAANFGIHIAASSSNIIVRNMTIGLTPGGGSSDIVSIEGMSDEKPTNIWIDHNTFFTALVECSGAGDTSFDGMIDVKKGADNVTVSYNYLHDHTKMSLNGYSDSDTAVRHITFHHNLVENVGSRTPLQRGGYSHLFNNYFLKIVTSGANVRMNGYSLIEANYFENVKNPVTSRDSDAIGYWDLRGNNLVTKADVAAGNGFGITWDNGNSGTVNAIDWVTTKPFPVSLGYEYAPDSFQCVHDGLRAVAGAGKALATLTCH